MKYRQLTKEQFSALHEEFAQFLATQQIDVKEWEFIKSQKSQLAEDELNIFSDVVWEDVLTKTAYLEHISENHINLFKCDETEIHRIYIQLNSSDKSFLNKIDFDWFLNNPLADGIEYFKASKKYNNTRNFELFELIEKGSQISKGELYTSINALIP
jgi:uncharacterized protein YecA (UPF0149 family)